MSKHRILALTIILIAFALRVYALDAVWHDTDSGWPHGLATIALESLLDGHYQDPAPRLYGSTLGLPNPLAAVYLWMTVGLVDRSPYTAFALTAMLNVLMVAMTFDLARRLFGRSPAIAAGFLAATSTWSIFIGRNTNLPGLLEFGAVASAWMVMSALKNRSGRRLLAGFAATAIVMQTYALAMGLAAQVAMLALVIWTRSRRLLRPIILGFALLAVSALIQTLPWILARGTDPRVAMSAFPEQSTSIPNPFGVHLNLAAFDHALRMVSGRDFQAVALFPGAPDFPLLDSLGKARAAVIDGLILVGVILAIARSRRDIGSRMVLTWFLVPTVTATALMATFITLHTTYYYMPIASPGGYLLAALPFSLLDWRGMQTRLQPLPQLARTAVSGVAIVGCLCQLGISGSHLLGYAELIANQPLPQEMPRGPLSWQLRLGALWRAHCSEVDDPWPVYWTASVLQTARPIRTGASQSNDVSDVWAVSPQGGNCTMRLITPAPAPELATPIPLQLNDHLAINIYRSVPFEPGTQLLPGEQPTQVPELRSRPGSTVYDLLNARAPLQVNLNWTLTNLATTPVAMPGSWVTVTEVMRIDALPQESYWNWYFAPFVNLSTTDEHSLVTVDGAVALQGSMWRVNDITISTVRLQVPANTLPGMYKLNITLFDSNQRKNAVFFAPGSPGKPILSLQRSIDIVAPTP